MGQSSRYVSSPPLPCRLFVLENFEQWLTYTCSESGKIPLICLDDVGSYSLWLFDNPQESAGLDLKVATDEVSFADIAAVFTKVTGTKGVHKRLPLEEWLSIAEPYPNAPANFSAGPNIVRDEATMPWRENFSAWWRFWSETKAEPRDWRLLDRIHPTRVKSLEEWMRKVHYAGQPKSVLKEVEGLKKQTLLLQHGASSS